MSVISVNVNGLRAGARKGLFAWLQRQRADIICLQETRVPPTQCGLLPGYHCYYLHAEKKGYSGVVLLSLDRPEEIVEGFGRDQADAEARYLEVR